jgi:hypothetical protein
MFIRLFSVCLGIAALAATAADPPAAKPVEGKSGMEEWATLNTEYKAISRALMTRRNTIVKESEEAKVIQAQIRDLTKKIQELQQGLAKLVEKDEEYKKLQAQMLGTRSKLHAVQISRRAPSRYQSRPVVPPALSDTSAPGPPPPPPPPPPLPTQK